MAYTHITWANLKAALAARLHDTGNKFWLDAELGLYLGEALRVFGAYSNFWRAVLTLTTDGSTFYNLPAHGGSPPLDYTLTDRTVINEIEYHLLEPAVPAAGTADWSGGWTGTTMFTMADVTAAIQRRTNQFLAETGVVVTRSTMAATGGRLAISESIMDVRRVVWYSGTPTAYAYLQREDETLFDSNLATWGTAAASAPTAYSVMAPPPLYIQLYPVTSLTENIELLTVNRAATFAPTAGSSGTEIGIPDSLVWAVKWGAIADLLSKDGPAMDPFRAKYAEARYKEGVRLAKVTPSVLRAYLTNPLDVVPLFDLDLYIPNWEASAGTVTTVALAGLNMVAVYPTPAGASTVYLDVVRPAPTYTGTDAVQVGIESMEGILDYAEHIAAFKCGGVEFERTLEQASNFLVQSATSNDRLKAAAPTFALTAQGVWGEEERVPRV